MISFEQLPQAVQQLSLKLDVIEQLLQKSNSSKPSDELLTVDECAQFLNLSKQTIYGLISKGKVPVMKRSKRCYFLKADLIEYLKAGKKKMSADIDLEVNNYLSQKGGKNGR